MRGAVDLEGQGHRLRSSCGCGLRFFGGGQMGEAGDGCGGKHARSLDEGAAGEFDISKRGGLVLRLVDYPIQNVIAGS